MRKSYILTSILPLSMILGQGYGVEIPADSQTPASVETRLGKLEFPLGVPAPKTVETLYDHLDYIHGINSFLTAFSGASLWAFHEGFLKIGVPDNFVLIFSNLIDSKSLFLTANADAVYFFSFVDLSDGPVVIEMPPHTQGFVNDMWQRWVIDMGVFGPDRGLGGKYLIVPPNYKGGLPDGGFFIARARTTRVFCSGNAFLEGNDPEIPANHIKKNLRIYPYSSGGFGTSLADILAKPHSLETKETWSSALNEPPPETHFVEGSGLPLNTIPPNDVSFYERINSLVQGQPAEALDPKIAGNLAAIGIVKGKDFQPDEHLKQTLSAAATHGNAVSRVLVFRSRPSEDFNFYGSSSHWINYDEVRKLDARTALFYIATGISPSKNTGLQGIGIQHLAAFLDNQNQPLDGSKTYRLKLPANIPADNWSLTLYDNQSRSMLDTAQRYPKAGSQSFPRPAVTADQDGSTTLYFSPQKPQTIQNGNWIQTLPEKGYFMILRFYGPLQSFFDKTWTPGEIEEVDNNSLKLSRRVLSFF